MNENPVGPADARAPNRWWVVFGAGAAVFLASVDMSVVNLALPAIQGSFRARPDATAWVVLGYLLPLIALALPGGRWLDRTGQRPALAWSCTGFALASLGCAVAPTLAALIVARALQGVAGAVLLALIPAMITAAVHASVRGRAMALVDTMGMLGLIIGPLVGGVLTDSLGWRWIFYLNVPACGLLFAVAMVHLPARGSLRPPGWRWVGEAGLLAAAVGALMVALGLAASRRPGWLAMGLAAVPLLGVWRRLPASSAVRVLLRMPDLRGPYLALAATAAATGLLFYLMPFYLVTTLGTSVAVAGLAVLAFPVAAAVFAPAAGLLADRVGARRVAVLGGVVMICGLSLLVPASRGWHSGDVCWRLAVIGTGVGLFNAPNMSAAMSAAPPDLLATTGAVTSLARQGGFAAGPTLATLIWGWYGYRTAGIGAALAAAAVLTTIGIVPLAWAAYRFGGVPEPDSTASTGPADADRVG